MATIESYSRTAARVRRVAAAAVVALGAVSLISSWGATGLRIRTVHMNILTAFVIGMACVIAFVVLDLVVQFALYATMRFGRSAQPPVGFLERPVVEDLSLLGLAAGVALVVLWFH